MSLCFAIACPSEIDTRTLVGDLDYEAITVNEHDHIRHFYLDDLSCRTVTLLRSESNYLIDLQDCSSLDDYLLAFALVRVIAARAKAGITCEDGSSYELKEFQRKFNQQWIEQHCLDSCLTTIGEASKLREGCITLAGVVRDFHIGPRVARELLRVRDRQDRAVDFFTTFLVTQWIPSCQYHEPTVFLAEVTNKKVATWTADTTYHFPRVDFLAVMPEDQNADPIFVSFEDLDALADDFAWLDESQCIVTATSAEWPQVVAKARKIAVDPVLVFGAQFGQ